MANPDELKIFIPGFEFSLIAGIFVLVQAVTLTFFIFGSTFFTEFLGPFLQTWVKYAVIIWLFGQYISGICMVVASLLIKHEDHSLAGSVMVLVVSLFGLFLAMGALVGPMLGIVGGILGLKEHQKVMHGVI